MVKSKIKSESNNFYLMKRIIYFLISIAFLFSSCKEDVVKADAYGNFETNTTIVSAKARGQLLFIDVEEGNFIGKQKLVAIVDTTQLHLQKQLLISQKESIGKKTVDPNPEIDVLKTQLANLSREKQRIQNLVNAKAATSKQLDDITGEITVVNQKIDAAKKNANVANRGILSQGDPFDAQIDIINSQISDSYIYNPFDGVVINKLAESSEIVGFGTPLYTIANMSSLTLRAYSSATALQDVKVGDQVSVEIDQQEGTMKQMEGFVSWISSEAEFTPKIIQTKKERVNLVYALKIEVKNDGSLKIGMPAEVNFGNASKSQSEE